MQSLSLPVLRVCASDKSVLLFSMANVLLINYLCQPAFLFSAVFYSVSTCPPVQCRLELLPHVCVSQWVTWSPLLYWLHVTDLQWHIVLCLTVLDPCASRAIASSGDCYKIRDGTRSEAIGHLLIVRKLYQSWQLCLSPTLKSLKSCLRSGVCQDPRDTERTERTLTSLEQFTALLLMVYMLLWRNAWTGGCDRVGTGAGERIAGRRPNKQLKDKANIQTIPQHWLPAAARRHTLCYDLLCSRYEHKRSAF